MCSATWAYQSPLIESSPLANLSTKNFVYAASHDTDYTYHPIAIVPIMEDHTIPKVEDLRLTIVVKNFSSSHLLSNVFRVQYQLTPDVGDLGLLDQNGPHLIQGLVSTEASIDFVVKVDVGGLSPKHQTGFFNAYANIANKKDIDIVLHLGDYIYEYAEGMTTNLQIILMLKRNEKEITLKLSFLIYVTQLHHKNDLPICIVGRDETDLRDASKINSLERTILGAEQENWLYDQLFLQSAMVLFGVYRKSGCLFASSNSRCASRSRFVGRYPANRARITSLLTQIKIMTPFLDWRSHKPYSIIGRRASFSISDLKFALEHLQLGMLRVPAQVMFKSYEPHLHHVNLCEHGYILGRCFTKTREAEYWYSSDIKISTTSERLGAVIVTERGSNRITESQIF
ncbi:hypothetical protein BASA83_005830 [Batrachochytrium salamandrivorans]|nr:hypothetical protein BASA83_005830 [Batrachochytrium salamandrivorans]